MISISTLKNRLIPKLHGASLAKIQDSFYDKLHEASTIVLARLDPPDTIQRARIDNAIYDKVYNYTAPSDIKGESKIIDIRPIGPRSTRDEQTQTYGKEFDIRKRYNSATIETIAGVKTLRISKALRPSTLLFDPNAVDTTVTTGGDVTDLTADNLDYVSGNASLSFGLSGVTGAGTIEINLSQSFDLSLLENIGALFTWLKFPTAARFTSYELRWGSDSSNYWSKTATVPQGRSAVDSAAWNLMPFVWSSASKTGTPEASAIAYLKVTITYTTGTALTFVKLDSIVAALGEAYECVYYSEYIYKTLATGVLKEIATLDSDIITLDPAATQILLLELHRTLAPELKGEHMAADLKNINYMLEGEGNVHTDKGFVGLYRQYESQHPSQALIAETTYYEFDEPGSDSYDDDTL